MALLKLPAAIKLIAWLVAASVSALTITSIGSTIKAHAEVVIHQPYGIDAIEELWRLFIELFWRGEDAIKEVNRCSVAE